MKKIAFIGVGRMGRPIVRNLMRLGFELHVFSESLVKVYDVVGEGAKYHAEISDCVKDCEVVMTMLGFPKDVEEVYFSRGNVMDSVKEGTYLIDMTTTSPTLSQRIFSEGSKRGFRVLDAPVSGSENAARKGKLAILVGGKFEDYKSCLPLLRAVGTHVSYMGEAGKGQHAMIASQIMIAGTLAGISEALAYVKAKGLDTPKFVKAISSSEAGSRQLDINASKIMDRDFTAGFSIRHFVKDMLIAIDEANRDTIKLDVLMTIMTHYRQLEDDGQGEMGVQSLAKFYGA